MATDAVAHLDTHVLVWLHGGYLHRFPSSVRTLLEARELEASPMALLELQYLFEIKRTRARAADVLAHLSSSIGLRLAEHPFATVAFAATKQPWTRDPFDRLIVAQAEVAGAALITKDETILANCKHACWD
jgi:PIN domain nuclease of toxin-antitoxin system